MIVIPGPASTELGKRTAELLGASIAPVEFKRFPDGESYIRIDGNLDREDVAIIQTSGPPQNENLLQLFLMADDAKDMGVHSIIAVVPYFAYSRQDKRFRYGEALSIKTMVSLLAASGVNEVLTVNAHNPNIIKTFTLPFEDLSAVGVLAQHFKNNGFDGAFSLSVGKKALDMVKQANDILCGEYGYIQTQRDTLTGKVTVEKKSLPVANRDVIVFDDIISSGGTMIEAIKWIKQLGAKRAYAACVHPILIGDAMERILKSGADGIIGTDCVTSPISAVSVAPLLAEALKKRGF